MTIAEDLTIKDKVGLSIFYALKLLSNFTPTKKLHKTETCKEAWAIAQQIYIQFEYTISLGDFAEEDDFCLTARDFR